MNWPPDPIMLMCVAHAAGDKFVVRDGELHITVQSEQRTMVADRHALDDLEAREWIEVKADGETVLTENGLYWTKRWLTQCKGKGQLKPYKTKPNGFQAAFRKVFKIKEL